ncbi:MAG: AAA family ATPase [Candidatus Melainabacteria bacterium]|nr:AAA family ATPase [Candidatus Melainabacteria bacterium]
MQEKIPKIKRLLQIEEDYSCFLFGARGSGKTTLINELYQDRAKVFDLLDVELESRLQRNPNLLKELVEDLDQATKYVVIDEVQKIPKLLNLVHQLIESTDKFFILTGSSARKLKRGQANLLAGRAFSYFLHPYTSKELGDSFDLDHALRWGMLPKVQEFKTEGSKSKFLKTYCQTYLKEEIFAEQFVRALDPFRHFLELAAQMNGKILNYSKLAKDIGVDDKTVSKYYSILEDTLIGFSLKAFKHSFRKQLATKPKFYLFDTGVKRSLDNSLTIPLQESSFAYGNAFEHFVILDIIKLASYFHDNYRFSYLRTKDGVEVDLVVERPGLPHLFIEIKSSKEVDTSELKNLSLLATDFGDCEAVCFSRDKLNRQVDDIELVHWQEGLERYFC